MITAKEARQKVEELKNSLEERMKKARIVIEEDIQNAINCKDTYILLPSYKQYPEEIWQELKDLGYGLEFGDGNVYIKW